MFHYQARRPIPAPIEGNPDQHRIREWGPTYLLFPLRDLWTKDLGQDGPANTPVMKIYYCPHTETVRVAMTPLDRLGRLLRAAEPSA